MGLLNEVREKTSGKKCVRVDYEQMVELVSTKFIRGADDAFLKEVKDTAKGSFFGTTISEVSTPDQVRTLRVTPVMGSFFILLFGKTVMLIDEEEQVIYDIKSRQWKKFYKSVLTAIEAEKRTR